MAEINGLAAPLRGGGFEGFNGFRLDAPLRPNLALRANGGMQYGDHGGLSIRDAVVGASWIAVSRPDLVVRLSPAVTLPVGDAVGGLGSPGSTHSVDPWLSAEIFYGATWLVGGRLSGRAPLYAGSDGARQGLFGRADLMGARRVSDRVVPWAGASLLSQGPGDAGGDVWEVAGIAGAVFNLAESWSLSAQVRAPVVTDNGAAPYLVAGGLGLTRVFGGGGGDDHGEEEEDGHHEGDGHDH